MLKYLIDANLPYRFSLWHAETYIHQFDIQFDAEDFEIWQYAKERNLTIITKDADFSERISLATPPPRVIHLRTGNMNMRDFHQFVTSIWSEVEELSNEYKLVVVFNNKIEAFN
jgi:predicted nuclease of predicted toxin-antitoxin system